MTCKLRSIQISPRVAPTSRGKAAPVRSGNSWEKGTVKDERGMPLIGGGGQPIGVKQYAEQHHVIEEQVHKLEHDPHVFDTKG